MRTKLALWLLLVPTLARANGSMGLGLEIWSVESWAVYCVAMVLLEAWLIGSRAKIAFPKALGISAAANFVTGMACGPLGCCAVGLHTGDINPNPLLRSIMILIVFAIPSALVESILWTRFVPPDDRWKLVVWSIAVHLITIPVGWAILMLPDHPYRGTEMTASVWRSMRLTIAADQVNNYISEKGHLPNALDARSLLEETKEFARDTSYPATEEVFFYVPDYGRFSTGEEFKHPFTFNRRILGKSIEQIKKMTKFSAVPYITGDSRWGDVVGLFYNPESGTVGRSFRKKGDPTVDWTLQ